MAPISITLRHPHKYENPLCAQTDPRLFFLDDDDDETLDPDTMQRSYSAAAVVCANCEHKEECAEWGIRNEVHGFWGGLSPHQRRDVRIRRRITVSDTV